MKYVRKNNIKISEKNPEGKSEDMSNRMPGDIPARISKKNLKKFITERKYARGNTRKNISRYIRKNVR